jgi:hypothetical protein
MLLLDAFTDEAVVLDEQGPLTFIQKNNGPARGLAHVHLEWDEALHDTVGNTQCVDGRSVSSGPDCPPVGRIRHLGSKFESINDPEGGLPVTANADIVGIAGGYGWLLDLDGGAPHTLQISKIEVMSDTILLLSIAYPTTTSFTIKAKAAYWCSESSTNSCEELFSEVPTVDEIRDSPGNIYHFDQTTGLLTIRVAMFPQAYTGEPDWQLYDFTDLGQDGKGYALESFERDGVLLPVAGYWQMIEILADCAQDGAYCTEAPPSITDYDDVCSPGFEQVSYDRCCRLDSDECEYAGAPASDLSSMPSSTPSHEPSSKPSSETASIPSSKPSDGPSSKPTSGLSVDASSTPSVEPMPSLIPSAEPSSNPSSELSSRPSSTPSDETSLDLVGADDNTEQVTIPQPLPADLSSSRTDCPHQDVGHIDWTTQFTSLAEGEDVTLPENTSILITESITTKLGLVTIPTSSELIFGEDANGITMDVEGMEVEGSLIAGSETCRYETPLTITLHGTRPDGITNIANAKPTSYKGISVTGRLELHGKRYYRTWTR